MCVVSYTYLSLGVDSNAYCGAGSSTGTERAPHVSRYALQSAVVSSFGLRINHSLFSSSTRTHLHKKLGKARLLLLVLRLVRFSHRPRARNDGFSHLFFSLLTYLGHAGCRAACDCRPLQQQSSSGAAAVFHSGSAAFFAWAGTHSPMYSRLPNSEKPVLRKVTRGTPQRRGR